ncbi:dihydroneopterin aldolase [Roseisolibacter sp. H3M3-2]|uniref:dihydroneopterin aldolase n=1 Tax=Roseisolibacter sp. H3M3-2 TaxID=3031323 RepID=UPI0023DB5D2C|nr:dihydroneopterin aldolase [Roseisolibacter sp. H3M3-2]MDF1501535.1 dihydroneopterin aldolase [Roseisolibacter sp. H3M3-2]
MTDRLCVSLAGMRFHARVGILAHERELAQPLEIDVDAWRDVAPGAPVLDYRALYDAAADVVASTELLYLEDVAARVADRALALGAGGPVRVAVRTPHVALPGPLAHAGGMRERAAAAGAAGGDGVPRPRLQPRRPRGAPRARARAPRRAAGGARGRGVAG